MSQKEFAFSKSAITRFSHDLAGVISAVSNSLALLDELGGADQETLKLAADNADILMGRLRFFRAAFGNEGPLTDLNVTRRIFEGYLATLENRIVHYDCVWQTDSELPIFIFRLILLGGTMAVESLPRGGRITVQARAGRRRICFEAEGKTAVFDPAIQAALDDSLQDVSSPKAMPAVFLQECLFEQGWQASVSYQDGKTLLVLSEKEN
ncbi:MAG: hypothetical protein IKR09_07045 [Alphaproteobacteria bacterium]|nr:hypothetical protein [Alphaproteobacteria bacterium]